MSATLGAAAVRLSGLAARLLGWRPPQFWDATPAELAAALTPPGAGEALDREGLEQLLEQDDG